MEDDLWNINEEDEDESEEKQEGEKREEEKRMKMPKSFDIDSVLKFSFVRNEYTYLSMPNGQCGAYACALSSLI